LRRLEGDLLAYRKVKKYIFESCAEVLTGLPEWAIKLQEQKLEQLDNGQDDDYDLLLQNNANDANDTNLIEN